ncbi:MAG: hypothetical protein VKO65_05275 [Cyanobacteriota bacterium]|nr:hypothetical protein [Cyanobacteriota bacterium]
MLQFGAAGEPGAGLRIARFLYHQACADGHTAERKAIDLAASSAFKLTISLEIGT